MLFRFNPFRSRLGRKFIVLLVLTALLPLLLVVAVSGYLLAPSTLAELQGPFVVVAALTLLPGMFLGAWQVARLLAPVDRLIEGAHRISQRDFATRVAVDSGDELAALADAFNEMTRQVGKQFELLAGLSRLDQLILKVPDLEQVAQVALATLQHLTQADAVAVALGDPAQPEELTLLSWLQRAGSPALRQHRLSEAEQAWLAQMEPVQRTVLSDVPMLEWLWPGQRELLAGGAHLFAVTVHQQRVGMLAVAWNKSVRLPEADRQLLKDFAERLAVAVDAVLREKKLYQQTHFDMLTGLPNRQLLKDRLEQALRHATAKGHSGAVLCVNLDHFRQINEGAGHAVGDEILRRTAERLRICVSEEDTVARHGADEFAVLLQQIDSPLRASRVADKIVTMLGSPYRIDDGRHHVGASVGIALFPADGQDVDTLLRNADAALYQVKQEGRGHYRFFEEAMNQVSQQRRATERRIRDALEQGHILLHYQPQWYFQRDRFSVEALVRIRDPEVGIVAPLEFIGVAEDTGLILEVGEWVLREACQQMASWRAAGLAVERMAVNVSARQLAHRDFVRTVESALADFRLDFADLELEVTESILIQDTEGAQQKLGHLHAKGVRIAIDDFGTGFSSLSYLHRLPFDVVKIDQNFVSTLQEDHSSLEITRTIVGLARTLNKIVVGEGVETREQLMALRELQCDGIQGFYISRPLTASKAEEFIAQFRPVNFAGTL